MKAAVLLALIASGLVAAVPGCRSDSLRNREAIAQLQSGDPAQRMHAADKLGRNLGIDADAPDAIDALIVALDDSVALVQSAAVAALAGTGLRSARAIPALVRTLHDSAHARAREGAAMVLGDLGRRAPDEVARELTVSLSDPVARVRVAAVTAVGRIGAQARDALPLLARRANDTDVNVRIALAGATTDIDASSPKAANILLQLLGDSYDTVRAVAAAGLGNYTEASEREVSALTGALRDPQPMVRIAAASALGRLGTKATTATTALRAAVVDPDARVRAQASAAIRSIQSVSGRP